LAERDRGTHVPGSTDAVLTAALPRLGYVFYAAEGAKVTLEVTHGGTDEGLDTQLKLYGPRLADGTYPKTLASDDDSGYGKLSKIGNVDIAIGGFYLAELTTPAATGQHARLKLSCVGSCQTDAPVTPLTEDLRWYTRSAERRSLTLQTYRYATERLQEKAVSAPPSWAVVLDIDETTLNNSAYQKSRQDLGVGFSPASWTAWVAQKAAPAIDGVVEFAKTVHQLGGKVVLVSNRKALVECSLTEMNLAAVGVSYDAIRCQDGPSDKNPRSQAIAAGTAKPGLPALQVLEYVGDNIQDFPALTQDLRKLGADACRRIRRHVLPDPESDVRQLRQEPRLSSVVLQAEQADR